MTENLQALSNGLAGLVETVGASIVRVEARRRHPASGVIISEDGFIVSTHHVVERDENIKVGLADGQVLPATLVGRDASTDLVVLKVDATGLTPARWATVESAKVGHLVLAMGRPDVNVQATLGVVSAVDQGWRTRAGGDIDAFLQTDVTMYPGFSGGPLVAADGSFLGINTSGMMRRVNLTIPSRTVNRVVDMLRSHGHVRRGFLGISTQPVRLPNAVAESAGQETGLLIASVEANSPAENSGLYLGDVILTLDGVKTRHIDELLGTLSGDRVGKTIPVSVLRGGQMSEVSVTVGERS